MTLAIIHTRAQLGIDALPVTVEAHLSNGLPGLSIVGLPEATVRESKDRVRSALLNARFEFPARRITINLAPADLPKEGGRFDLPIALGILAASGQIAAEPLRAYEWLGELALTGELRAVRGVLPAVRAAGLDGRTLIVPAANADEAGLMPNATVRCARHLLEISAHLRGEDTLHIPGVHTAAPTAPQPDLGDVRGQPQARRALEIAAAGGHHLLFCGPPGSGKTLLAQRLPGILPPMTEQEMLEVAAIRSIGGDSLEPGQWQQRPFRAPHHTASSTALVGGGSNPRPGEVSLAHHGVLFLDELPEFPRRVLDVLREPLESGDILISRAARQVRFPAAFQLVAAMNPSPTGGPHSQAVDTDSRQARQYRERVSGPLLDRIDLQLAVQQPPRDSLLNAVSREENSASVRERVIRARDRQMARQGCRNSLLQGNRLRQLSDTDREGRHLLETALAQGRLSARGLERVLRVARTLADLDGSERVQRPHLAEALALRQGAF